MFSWELLHSDWHGRRKDKVLAKGRGATLVECRRAVVQAEKEFPVTWCPEIHYVVRSAGGEVE